MSGNYGLEKFSHLEDKIYRTIEQIKRERQQRETLEHELANLRGQVDKLRGDKERLESQLQRLLGDVTKSSTKSKGCSTRLQESTLRRKRQKGEPVLTRANLTRNLSLIRILKNLGTATSLWITTRAHPTKS